MTCIPDKPKVANQTPPSVREMVIIAAGLTVVCLVAAMILGGLYFVTQPAKEHNLHMREETMIRGLLGLTPQARIQEVRRYLTGEGKDMQVIYLTGKRLAQLELDGKEVAVLDVPGDIAAASAGEVKDEWVKKQVKAANPEHIKYAGRFFVGIEGSQPAGYVVEGVTLGFKTWVRFFMAIDSAFTVQGVEIIEHEEDPGLGAEIVQRYFKNQFAGRSFDDIEKISVTKDPMPKEWQLALEQLGDMPFRPWLEKYKEMLPKNPNIYAITGSTISSTAVTVGVKAALGNFRKRMNIVGKYL
ncbi:Ion-translocating oxidoreductase complex subunit G [Georgfuchsia toluolica]|uniref:Ion-translocating oxidoreductase complex subunit G n=1 Tax=Georgfuchsia toluolica TaxID=424218 RepID=A0A916J5J0_9PROT|nr:FMN-binding protein [Georgfuchsia toluolica]CAG4883575.1 Ion-translocating oxidoreductase complex subunit G [Georgfuchsia toluolica]